VDRIKDPVFRRGRKRLFVSIIEGFEREIRPATVAWWIVSTIQLAYSLTNMSPDLRRGTAHEVHALATSWAAYRGVVFGDVLEAAFSQFYLRNCSVLADGMQSIGPVVAAQHVV
jgi:hypothetical protein